MWTENARTTRINPASAWGHGATHAVADGHMYGMQRLSYDLLNYQ